MPPRPDLIEKMTAADKLLRLGTLAIFVVLLLAVTVRSFGDGPVPQAGRVAGVPTDSGTDVAQTAPSGATELQADGAATVEPEPTIADTSTTVTPNTPARAAEGTEAEAGSMLATEQGTTDPAPEQNVMTADASVNWLQDSPILANADIANGEGVFRQCATCHQYAVERNGGGPHLVGIVGRDIGTAESWRYSKAMLEAEGIWTPERLNQWLTNPDDYIPGNRMAYPGVRDDKDRIDLIGFLASQGK